MTRQIKSYFAISCKDSKRFHRFDGVDFVEVVEAVDSRTDPIKCCEDNKFKIKIKKHLNDHFDKCIGAFGCFMSHHYLWEKIASFDDDFFYCILEDDIRISKLKKFYELNYFPKKSLVNLSHRGKHSASAYVLNKQMADLLINECNRTITHPVDKFMFAYITQMYPNLCEKDSHIPLDDRFKHDRDILKRK
jgi:GR25 family glycosyltransferase involved in LPS biosynthesis